MSPSSSISSLLFAAVQVNVYVGSLLFVLGILGGFLNLVVLISLRTFRESSCAFYLTMMSLLNLGQLFSGLFSRVLINVWKIDWTESSLVFCKLRMFFLVACTTNSMLCLALATVDQYLSTSSRPRWNELKFARLFSLLSFIFSLGTSVPCLIFYEHQFSALQNKVICTASDPRFVLLNIIFYRFILSNVLPLLVTLVFGSLTYRHVQQLAHRTIPLVRRELDKQLTRMILAQDVLTFFLIIPITVMGFLSLVPSINLDPLSQAEFQLANVIAVMCYYLYFAVRLEHLSGRQNASLELFRVPSTSICLCRSDFVVN